jgi:hypothetical protein
VEPELHSDGQVFDAQLQSKLNAQRLSFAILVKRLPILIVILLLLFAAFEYYFWVRSSASPDRYSATARLVYYPKVSDASSVDVKLVVDLFYRRSLRMAAAAQLGLSPEQSASLENRLSATQMRNRNNLILITAMDSTAEKARELNNVVVRLLLQEFQQFRGGNLEVKLGLLQKQKDAWLKELAECELELQKLLNPTTMASPEQELCNIRKMITDQLFLISELNVKVGNESARLQEINAKLQGLSPDIDNQIKTLNYYLSEEQRLNQELLRARQLYTDQNPKVKALLAELDTIKDQREKFVQEKDLSNLDPELARNAEAMRLMKQNSEDSLSLLEQRLKVTENELKNNQKRAENLLNGLAAQGRLQSRINSISSSLRKIEDDLTKHRTALSSIAQELVVIDEAQGASLTDRVMLKSTAIAAGSAGFLVFNLAWLWVMLLFFWGKIESGEEFPLLAAIDNLGEFPDLRRGAYSQERLQEFVHDIFFRLQETMPEETGVIFQVIMQGSHDVSKLDDLLDVNFALRGLRVFHIKCVTTAGLMKPCPKGTPGCHAEWEEELLGVEKLTARCGQFCINNLNLLLDSEVEILSRDVEIIKKHYDLVRVSRADTFSGQELFFSQMANFSDCVVLFLGYRRSSRRMLRELRRTKEGISSHICAVLTGVNKK